MPKIVPDMQNKILTTAERQFKENGFDKTDMREVAAEAEVAVGTIYLHYQNKETLYMHVISHSWENTLQRIEEISTSDNEPAKRLKFILHELVQDMVKRKSQSSLWMEIGSMHHHQMGNLPMNGHVSGVRDPISRIISTLLKEIAKKKHVHLEDRTFDLLGSFTFIMTVDTCMQDQEKAADSIDLIFDLVNSYLN